MSPQQEAQVLAIEFSPNFKFVLRHSHDSRVCGYQGTGYKIPYL